MGSRIIAGADFSISESIAEQSMKSAPAIILFSNIVSALQRNRRGTADAAARIGTGVPAKVEAGVHPVPRGVCAAEGAPGADGAREARGRSERSPEPARRCTVAAIGLVVVLRPIVGDAQQEAEEQGDLRASSWYISPREPRGGSPLPVRLS